MTLSLHSSVASISLLRLSEGTRFRWLFSFFLNRRSQLEATAATIRSPNIYSALARVRNNAAERANEPKRRRNWWSMPRNLAVTRRVWYRSDDDRKLRGEKWHLVRLVGRIEFEHSCPRSSVITATECTLRAITLVRSSHKSFHATNCTWPMEKHIINHLGIFN